MYKNFFNKETKSIKAGALILAFSSLASRLLGILRDRILASQFGAGDALDIYYASFQIPDFFYNIFILGTLSVAFIPIFTSYVQNNNLEFNDDAIDFTNTILNMVLIGMGLGCLLLIFFTPLLINLVAPGFKDEKYKMAVSVTRILLISPFFFSISSIFGSVLTSFKRFIAISLAPIVYNLGIIFGAIFLAPTWGTEGLACGVILGAASHILIQLIPAKNLGYKYKSVINLKNDGVKKFSRLFLPRIIGIDISQASLLIGSILGSTLCMGSITIFNFANNLQSMPIGLFGISLVSAAFPHLSAAFAKNDFEQFRKDFHKTASLILCFIIPSSVFLFILRTPIIQLLLAAGKFTDKDVLLTSAVLGCFCISLCSQGLTPLFLRSFYSMHDTITPVIISVITIIIDVAASYTFVNLLDNSNFIFTFSRTIFGLSNHADIRVLGLAIGFSLASWFSLIILYIVLRIRLKNLYEWKILFSTLKFSISSIIAGSGMYFLLNNLEKIYLNPDLLSLILMIGIIGLTGIVLYVLICWIMDVEEIKGMIKKES